MREVSCLERWSSNWAIRVLQRMRSIIYLAILISRPRYVLPSSSFGGQCHPVPISFHLCPFGPSCAVIYSIGFIIQGFFSGTYNALSGKLRHNTTEIGEVSGRWSHLMEIKMNKVRFSSQRYTVTFLILCGSFRQARSALCLMQSRMDRMSAQSGFRQKTNSNLTNPGGKYNCLFFCFLCSVRLTYTSFLFLSRIHRLWKDLTAAITAKDMDQATTAKSSVEDAQRELRKRNEEAKIVHVPRFFELKDGRWEPKIKYVMIRFDDMSMRFHLLVHSSGFLLLMIGILSHTDASTIDSLKIPKRPHRLYSNGYFLRLTRSPGNSP